MIVLFPSDYSGKHNSAATSHHKMIHTATEEISIQIQQIKEVLDDHLESINDNTNEIQLNFEFLKVFEDKLDQLTDKIDRIQLFLEKKDGFKPEKTSRFKVKKLSKQEKEVFLVFYSLDEVKNGMVSIQDLAKRLTLSEQVAQNYITNLINKGIPIIKKYVLGKAYICLNKEFRSIQAKENILEIEQRILPVA